MPMAPIPIERAEAIILYYIELRYLYLEWKVPKIYYFLERKARELGFSLRMALYLVRFGKDIGMVEEINITGKQTEKRKVKRA